MARNSITSTEFQTRAGTYLDQAAKGPVFITRHKRAVRVLLDIDEYERLKQYDTRQSLYPHELSDELKAELEKGWQGARNKHLDHLMDE
ncbi:MAG: type II toxin-antitoxin system Phd/YefM family antitoxin [Alphaproteobacteria bacterium]|jgi:prevent-host-death family protein|nr:type II toxin-antitoxin system Phd/YefM family antitoxin [Alphaproteobacteria bacterium]|tara:strand:- start:899 stop:1165 length:267 start_codon:yes stop_codon:yes gene_type:complete